MAKAFYDLKQTAEKLGISTDEVRKLVAEGKLDSFQDRNKEMFDRDQVEDLAALRESMGGEDLDDTGEMLTLDDTGEALAIETDGVEIADMSDATVMGEEDTSGDGTAAGDTALGDDTQSFEISLEDDQELDAKGETDAMAIASNSADAATSDLDVLEEDTSGESTGFALDLEDSGAEAEPPTQPIASGDSVMELSLEDSSAQGGTEDMSLEDELTDLSDTDEALELEITEKSGPLEFSGDTQDLDLNTDSDLELEGTKGGTEELELEDELSDLAATDSQDAVPMADSGDEVELGETGAGTEAITLGESGGTDAVMIGGGDDDLEMEDSELDAGLSAFDTAVGSAAGGTKAGAGDTGPRGVSVFDTHEIDAVDSMARTQVEAGAVDEDELSLESVGSGSGLLDLTREADDTSLGAAELLDDIAPSGESQAGGTLEATGAQTASTGIFEAGADEDGMVSPLEEGIGAEAEAGMALATVAHGSAEEAEVFGGLTMLVTFAALVVGVLVAFTGAQGQISPITQWITSDQSHVWMAIGGAAAIGIIMLIVDFVLNKK